MVKPFFITSLLGIQKDNKTVIWKLTSHQSLNHVKYPTVMLAKMCIRNSAWRSAGQTPFQYNFTWESTGYKDSVFKTDLSLRQTSVFFKPYVVTHSDVSEDMYSRLWLETSWPNPFSIQPYLGVNMIDSDFKTDISLRQTSVLFKPYIITRSDVSEDMYSRLWLATSWSNPFSIQPYFGINMI